LDCRIRYPFLPGLRCFAHTRLYHRWLPFGFTVSLLFRWLLQFGLLLPVRLVTRFALLRHHTARATAPARCLVTVLRYLPAHHAVAFHSSCCCVAFHGSAVSRVVDLDCLIFVLVVTACRCGCALRFAVPRAFAFYRWFVDIVPRSHTCRYCRHLHVADCGFL